jgi:regulatory protein
VGPNPRSSASGRKRPRGFAPAGTAETRTARSAGLALVSRRDYSAAEITTKLKDKDYDADAIADAIEFLRVNRFLDDRRVAAAHVRTATAIKGRGRVRIARELAARGLAPEVIEDAMRAVEPESERAAIQKILSRKRWPATPTRSERDRMFRHLFARGFPADLISKALGRRQDDED